MDKMFGVVFPGDKKVEVRELPIPYIATISRPLIPILFCA